MFLRSLRILMSHGGTPSYSFIMSSGLKNQSLFMIYCLSKRELCLFLIYNKVLPNRYVSEILWICKASSLDYYRLIVLMPLLVVLVVLVFLRVVACPVCVAFIH